MTYYKATEVAYKPFIQWDLWASTHEEYIKLGLDADPLVIAEENIPPYEFGVCPFKIVDGELVDRDAMEMEGYEAEYTALSQFVAYPGKARDVNTGFFVYAGLSFPMYETARLYYTCIERTPANYKVQHTTGLYDLDAAGIPAFLDAYYNQLKTLTQPI